MAPVYSWHQDGVQPVEGRFQLIGGRLEIVLGRLREFLAEREADWPRDEFTGGPKLCDRAGLVIGVVSEPTHGVEVVGKLARFVGNERAASGVVLFPKVAAAMFVPDAIIDGLIELRLTLDYAPRKNMLRDAERILARHDSRIRELETASERDSG